VIAPESILPLDEIHAPESAEAVAEAVAACSASGTPLYPLGGGTKLGYGAWPRQSGHGLSLAKLARVVDQAARDLTITVEAGMKVADLARHLAEENQRLPLDVAEARHATIGGLVATNLCGPRRYRFGTMRDYVLGFAGVDGSGMPFRGGGKVVKNATGYNMGRLLTGSLGSIAVLTEVTLMVRPQPETHLVLSADLPTLDRAKRLLDALPSSKTLPAAVELLLGRAWQDQPGLEPWHPDSAARLVVAFEDAEPDVEWMAAELTSQWREAGVEAIQRVGAEQTAALWANLVETIPPGAAATGATDPVVQVGVPSGAVVDIAARLAQIDPQADIQAHAGSGVVRGRLSVEPAALKSTLADEIRPAADLAGGHAVVLSAPPEAALDHNDVWGPPPSGLTVMQSIKDRFDPKHVLNRGRFVFG
jgi:glycolate oxidase FAD binding subunit